MEGYFTPITRHQAEDGFTLAALTSYGSLFAVGAGISWEIAEKRLRTLIFDSMAAAAEHGDPAFDVLSYGQAPGQNCLLWTIRDLFPILLRQYRHAQKLTQADVARRMGIKQAVYAKLERLGANPTLDTVHRLETALDQNLIFQPVP